VSQILGSLATVLIIDIMIAGFIWLVVEVTKRVG